MEPRRYESRGVRCLECTGLEIKAHPELAKGGFGRCAPVEDRGFVSFAMARNCLEFEAAPPEVVKPREQWNNERRMFWQK